MPKVAVVGIDGATWNIILELVRNEKLPTFKELLEGGVHGELISTIPPVTAPAWNAIATGLTPGETGVIDFLNPNSGYALRPVNSSAYQGKAMWDFLSAEGYRVGVVDYPALYPAYPVNGFMLSSWLGKLDTWPKGLESEITEAFGEYNILVNYHLRRYDNIELFFSHLDKAVKKKLEVSRYLLKSKQPDLFVDVISFTDWLQHRLWHCVDPDHPLYPGDAAAKDCREKFAHYWQLIDEYLGHVTESADYIFVVSDHGFGPQWGVFNLAKWLEVNGFIVRKRAPLTSRISRKVVQYLPVMREFRRIYRVLPKKIATIGLDAVIRLSSLISQINTDKSKVLVLGHTIPFGAIYLNPRFKEMANEILSDIEAKLKKLNNYGLNVEIYRIKELYKGAYSSKLPDIILAINNWSCVIIKDFTQDFIYANRTYSSRHTGSHRIEGIFVAYGEDIRRGVKLNKTRVYDIAPTILHLFDAGIPENVHGAVLFKIFKKDSRYFKRKPVYVKQDYYRKKLFKIKLTSVRTRLTK